jgi:hypothetical protein
MRRAQSHDRSRRRRPAWQEKHQRAAKLYAPISFQVLSAALGASADPMAAGRAWRESASRVFAFYEPEAMAELDVILGEHLNG